MKEICDYKLCTGCNLCASVCPKQCISFTKQYNGHSYPVIDEDLCINCNKCVNSCIINQSTILKNDAEYGCYAAWSKDNDEHFESASGGLATLISRYVISQGGKVYGCAWNDNLDAVHIGVETESDLKKLQKSKYTLSHISKELYEDIKKELSNGRLCLFIGVGCQCDAIRKYIKDTNNLIIIDLLCHGGSSVIAFHQHLNYLTKKHRITNLNNVTFRGGAYDCQIALRHNDEVLYAGAQYSDEYFLGFMSHVLYRVGCFNCQYATTQRVGDITLADFWGLEQTLWEKYNFHKRGVNLMLVNTEKGKMILDGIKDQINLISRPLAEAVAGNETLKCPTPEPDRYPLFWKNYSKYPFEKAMHKTFKKEYLRIRYSLIIRILVRIKHLLKL